MKDTPWLDNIIWYKGWNLGHNATRVIKRSKRKEETSSDCEDEVEVKLQKVGGLWNGLAVNEGQTESGKLHKDYADAKKAFNYGRFFFFFYIRTRIRLIPWRDPWAP